ncbi:MAG: T9SS type A sorting domain-containing protein [Bacteroidota bacterium]
MTTFTTNVHAPVAARRQTNRMQFLYYVKICFLLFLSVAGRNYFSNAQCVAPYMSFHSPVLIAGTDHQPGAVYLFPEVMPGVDANIKIVDFVGGAQLWNIDDSTGAGYYDAFQPYVVAPADSVSYVDWEISFKVEGTTTDTTLNCFAVTGVDVDGNGSSLQEFIEAATPGSYALDANTILNFSFDGVRSKAVSLVDNVPLIDTAHREAMFQMNFTNISRLQYRNGAISTYSGDMVRQTCIYFKSFFDNYSLLLPVKMISFTAQQNSESVSLKWSATNEKDLTYYVVQKSDNGSSWKDIQNVMPGISATNNYFITDAGKTTAATYYRLKQIERNGQAVYSKVLKVSMGNINAGTITNNTVVKDAINLQIASLTNDIYNVQVFAVNGVKIKQQQIAIVAGFNTVSVDMPAVSGNGLYVLTVMNNRGEIIHHSKFVKN